MSTKQIMQDLRAENLLQDSHILIQVETLRGGLQYKTENGFVSFEDHFLYLQAGIEKIGRISLSDKQFTTAAVGEAYERELMSALETIIDDTQRWETKVIHYQGKLSSASAAIEELAASFEAWYILAATGFLADSEIKLPVSSVKALAKSEFNRLLDSYNLGIEALIEAVKIERQHLDSKRKVAREKFEMGREQVNAAWASRLPESLGISTEGPKFGVLQPSLPVDDLDEEPPPIVPTRTAPVSDAVPLIEEEPAPVIATVQAEPEPVVVTEPESSWTGDVREVLPNPAYEAGYSDGFDAGEQLAKIDAEVAATPIVEEEPAPVIQGTFRKTGDAQPVTVVAVEEDAEVFAPDPVTFFNDFDDDFEPAPVESQPVASDDFDDEPAPAPRQAVIIDDDIDEPAPEKTAVELPKTTRKPLFDFDDDDF